MRLSIGGVAVRLHGPAGALQQRFGAFAVTDGGGDAIEIAIDAEELRMESEVAPLALTVENGHVKMMGGWYDPAQRRGELRGVSDLGPVDAMVRLALSLALPEEGALLLHGAALTERRLVLVGNSGSGKSTAVRALGGDCDELSVVRGQRLYATPWWRGRAAEAPLSAIVVLERGGGEVRRLRGGEALRALLLQSVRYLDQPQLFGVAAALCRQVPVFRVSCPVGEAFVPFLSAQLAGVA